MLEAWFRVLLEHLDKFVAADFSKEELLQAGVDVSGALQQMRNTVDDVLDFRRVRRSERQVVPTSTSYRVHYHLFADYSHARVRNESIISNRRSKCKLMRC